MKKPIKKAGKKAAPPPPPAKKKTNLPAKQAAAGTDVALAGPEFEGGAGLENVTAKDILIPRLTLLQGLSPQVIKGNALFLPDARVGDFCDTGLQEIFKDKLLLLPCFYATIYLLWGPDRSGLVKNYGTDRSTFDALEEDEDRKRIDDDGNTCVETATYFALNLTAGGRKSFIPLSVTQLQAHRQWMTALTSEKVKRTDGSEFTPSIFYRTWEATVVQKTNKKGTWNIWQFRPGEKLMDFDKSGRLLEEAKKFYLQARDGLVRGDMSADENLAGGDNSGAM